MKQIKCEMCGGTDLLKQDGMLVCQSCGTKYAIEKTKSTSNADDSEKIDKWKDLMIDAFISCDFRRSRDYAYKILERTDDKIVKYILDVSHNTIMEKSKCENFSIFISKKGEKFLYDLIKSYELTDDDYVRYKKIFDEFSKYYTPYYNIKKLDKESLELFSDRIISKEVLLKSYKDSVEVLNKSIGECKKIYDACKIGNPYEVYEKHTYENIFYNLNKKYGISDEKYYTKYVRYSQELIKRCHRMSEYRSEQIQFKNFLISKGIIDVNNVDDIDEQLINDMLTLSNQYEKEEEEEKNNNNSSGHCYVATCVYGSYDCPEVWVLRRFRDYFLSQTVSGRLFIKVYYKISPYFIMKYGSNFQFKKINQIWLDKLVAFLKMKGYSSKPYKDM